MQAFLFIRMNGVLRCNSIYERNSYLFDILEFGDESPLTIRARCGAFRYFPDPLGIVPAEQLDKLEFG